MLYLFGGCLQEPSASQGKQVSGRVSNDVWAFDSGGQGWEEIKFSAAHLGCNIPTGALSKPPARAGHSMVAKQRAALMCGGYKYAADGRSKDYDLQGANQRMDCWWFTPEMWHPLKMHPSSIEKPPPRSDFSMSHDAGKDSAPGQEAKPSNSKFILFGGQTAKGVLLNDCWKLAEVPTETWTGNETVVEYAAEEYKGLYKWSRCDSREADSASSRFLMRPHARYGHQSVFFFKALYVIGGFAQDGPRVRAMRDIWILRSSGSGNASGVAQVFWEEMMPSSITPDARGFHAMWLSGFKILLHGGQGPSGSGAAAVLGDTWQFDLFTKEWKQRPTSGDRPVMSSLAINPLEHAVHALSFGGRDSEGRPSGRLYSFSGSNAENPWTRISPAGLHPSRRAGASLVLDQDSNRIIVSFGKDAEGMQDDTWFMDLTTNMWSCWYGKEDYCRHRPPNALYGAPGRIAFPSQVQVGCCIRQEQVQALTEHAHGCP
jgi:hypothetical protein